MGLRNTSEGWGWLARLFHWGVAGIIIFLLGLGFYTANIVSDVYVQFELVYYFRESRGIRHLLRGVQ